MTISEILGVRVLQINGAGSELGTEQSALDIIGEAYGQDIDLIAIPLERLSPDFLNLRTAMAGHFLQKFINYSYRIAIIGDVSAATLASQALRDFVTESNRGGRVLFARNIEALKDVL